MSQIIAGAVPFLLVLLLLPVAPTIERIVHTDFVHPSTTTSTTHPTARSTHTVAHASHGSTGQTTTTVPAAPSRNRIAPTVGRSASTSTTTSTTTATTTTTTTTDPPATDSGTLTTDNQEVSTLVTPNSNWIMSPESGSAVEWSLVCGSAVTPVSGESVTIEWQDTNCDLVVRSVSATPVTWKLTEY